MSSFVRISVKRDVDEIEWKKSSDKRASPNLRTVIFITRRYRSENYRGKQSSLHKLIINQGGHSIFIGLLAPGIIIIPWLGSMVALSQMKSPGLQHQYERNDKQLSGMIIIFYPIWDQANRRREPVVIQFSSSVFSSLYWNAYVCGCTFYIKTMTIWDRCLDWLHS